MKKLLLCFFLAPLSLSAFAGVETEIELSEVPEAVMKTAREAMEHAHYVSANTEVEENGYMVYEIQGTTCDGKQFEIDIDKNAEIEEIEVPYTKDLVPGAVLKAIEAKYPNFQFEQIEASLTRSKKVQKYEIVGTSNGKKYDLEVSASGRKIVESDS